MSESIPDFPKFSKLSYNYKKEIASILKKLRPTTSEFSLGFLYGYRGSFCFEVTKVLGNVCIRGNIQDIPSFLLLSDNGKVEETVKICLDFLNKQYGRGRINAVSKTMAEILKSNTQFKINDDRDNYDYVYKVTDLINLSGSKYHSKKNFVLQFEKKYSYEYRKLSSDVISQCIDLEEKWCHIKHCLMDESMSMENRLVYELLNNFEILGLFGGALFVDGKIQAFTVAEKLNPNTAAVHIEKANTEYKGIYQAINNIFCKKELDKFIFLNREQDVGNLGLRKAKLSYYPYELIEKYNIELA